MEGIAVNVYKKLKVFCRRRGYERLTVSGTPHYSSTVELGRRKRRFWRIKTGPRLRIISPRKFLVKLRNAYVNFMLRLAASPAVAGSGGGYGAVDYGVRGFGVRGVKDYDEKVIIEIYKSLVKAHGNLLVREAGNVNVSSRGICAPRV